MTDSPSVMVTVADRITPSAGMISFTPSEHLSILLSTVAQEMYSDTDAAGAGSGAGVGSGPGTAGCCACSCCFFSSSSRFCSSRRLASSCFLVSSSVFLASPAGFCSSDFLSSAVLSLVFAASCLPSALVVPVSAVSFFLMSVVCSCVAVGMLPGAYDTVFFRRRRRSAAGTAPAPTAKIGGFSSYLSFLIKAPYAEALSRPCVGCSVVTWKRASSGSAPQRLPPPGPRCPATAPSDCRPPCWQSRSCRCRPYRFRRSSTRRTPSHRRR